MARNCSQCIGQGTGGYLCMVLMQYFLQPCGHKCQNKALCAHLCCRKSMLIWQPLFCQDTIGGSHHTHCNSANILLWHRSYNHKNTYANEAKSRAFDTTLELGRICRWHEVTCCRCGHCVTHTHLQGRISSLHRLLKPVSLPPTLQQPTSEQGDVLDIFGGIR